jgi:hypothetical protein
VKGSCRKHSMRLRCRGRRLPSRIGCEYIHVEIQDDRSLTLHTGARFDTQMLSSLWKMVLSPKWVLMRNCKD